MNNINSELDACKMLQKDDRAEPRKDSESGELLKKQLKKKIPK